MNKNYLSEIKAGFQAGASIALGFIPIAMTFGILAKSSGISLAECVGFSAIVYAGASQFVALELLNSGAGVLSIIFTTLLFNFRHFIMGVSLSTKLNKNCLKWRPLIAFWMTDETYSISYLKQESVGVYFYLPMAATAYLSLSLGSLLGFQLGSIISSALSQSMGIALYAMFLAILAPEFKKSFKTIGIVVTSGILNLLIHNIKFIPQGWHIIIVIVLTVMIWNVIDEKNNENEEKCYE
ncbi:AzlC family ABC transporter permease [Clostridium ganghwense]|uniref:AzlC family ABC transporter permease n=1 Tax=Clostridium ganghwense TaxID=312089 RepID=A0ABT4CU53_9CLOT|nr:AzlC family ABC transporter permease [Clostridium ganghwense]MCY6371741.1 AzlC family ABC transporter permease [Clostridium ganghwense]